LQFLCRAANDWDDDLSLTPKILFAGYIVLFTALGITPYDRAVWWAENTPILLLVTVLVVLYRWHRSSPLAYVLMACLVYLHTIGGHYTFERVPFDFVTRTFGFHRNHYDRVAHFSVGFYAFGIAELLLAKRLVNSKVILFLFPVFAIATLACAYEIFEWWYAVHAEPSAGIAVLGSQGDVWDAHKDMLADVLGALFATALFWLTCRRNPAFRDLGRAPTPDTRHPKPETRNLKPPIEVAHAQHLTLPGPDRADGRTDLGGGGRVFRGPERQRREPRHARAAVADRRQSQRGTPAR
jgi:putative membrane protein